MTLEAYYCLQRITDYTKRNIFTTNPLLNLEESDLKNNYEK